MCGLMGIFDKCVEPILYPKLSRQKQMLRALNASIKEMTEEQLRIHIGLFAQGQDSINDIRGRDMIDKISQTVKDFDGIASQVGFAQDSKYKGLLDDMRIEQMRVIEVLMTELVPLSSQDLRLFAEQGDHNGEFLVKNARNLTLSLHRIMTNIVGLASAVEKYHGSDAESLQTNVAAIKKNIEDFNDMIAVAYDNIVRLHGGRVSPAMMFLGIEDVSGETVHLNFGEPSV